MRSSPRRPRRRMRMGCSTGFRSSRCRRDLRTADPAAGESEPDRTEPWPLRSARRRARAARDPACLPGAALMEIVLRATAMFAIMYLLLRLLGKRELGQMTPFELVTSGRARRPHPARCHPERLQRHRIDPCDRTFAFWSVALSWLSYLFAEGREDARGRGPVLIWQRRADPEEPAPRPHHAARDRVRDAAGRHREHEASGLGACSSRTAR